MQMTRLVKDVFTFLFWFTLITKECTGKKKQQQQQHKFGAWQKEDGLILGSNHFYLSLTCAWKSYYWHDAQCGLFITDCGGLLCVLFFYVYLIRKQWSHPVKDTQSYSDAFVSVTVPYTLGFSLRICKNVQRRRKLLLFRKVWHAYYVSIMIIKMEHRTIMP